MDLRWFQDFLTLAEIGNFTKAAEVRNLSQAAFSRRIQSLEQWLGVKLIDRAAFPTSLTPEGLRFKATALQVLENVSDLRQEFGQSHESHQVRIAMPFSLATTRFPIWLSAWNLHQSISCNLMLGNVHDTISDLIAGNVDIWLGPQQKDSPIPIDEHRYDAIEIDREHVRPYAHRQAIESGTIMFPGSSTQKIPLLMYSSQAYFSRLVSQAIQQAPQALHGYTLIESEMSEVLGNIAANGQGVAWLSESTVQIRESWDLLPLGDGAWDFEVSTIAYKSKLNQGMASLQVWGLLQKLV